VVELDQLIAQQRSSGTPVMVALNRRFYDVVTQVKTQLEPAAPVHVNVEWSEDPTAFAARGFTPAQVAKLHQANSLHGLDLMVHLGGALDDSTIVVTTSASARTATLSGSNGSGGLSTFTTSWELHLRWRVHAMSGTSRYLFAPLEQCTITAANVDTKLTVNDDDVRCKAGFIRQAQSFLRLIDSRADDHEATLSSVRPSMVLADHLECAFAKVPHG
jgi:predicted dehydrogenase